MNTSSADNLVNLPPLPHPKETGLEVEKVIWFQQFEVENLNRGIEMKTYIFTGASSAPANQTNPCQVQVIKKVPVARRGFQMLLDLSIFVKYLSNVAGFVNICHTFTKRVFNFPKCTHSFPKVQEKRFLFNVFHQI